MAQSPSFILYLGDTLVRHVGGLAVLAVFYGISILLLFASAWIWMQKGSPSRLTTGMFVMAVIHFALFTAYLGIEIKTFISYIKHSLLDEPGKPIENAKLAPGKRLDALDFWFGQATLVSCNLFIIWRAFSLLGKWHWMASPSFFLWVGTVAVLFFDLNRVGDYEDIYVFYTDILTVAVSCMTGLLILVTLGVRKHHPIREWGGPRKILQNSVLLFIESGLGNILINLLSMFVSGCFLSSSAIAGIYPTVLVLIVLLRISVVDWYLAPGTQSAGGEVKGSEAHRIQLVELGYRP